MNITLKKEVEQTIDIPVPAFFISKDSCHLIGVIDENTVVNICQRKGLCSISNGELWLYKNDLENAYNNYHSCTESEFLNKYAEVEKAMSLNPILKY